MADKPRIIMLRQVLAGRLAEAGGGAFDVDGPPPEVDKLDWLEKNGKGVPIVVALGMDEIDGAVLDRLPDLKNILIFGAGMDKVDLGEVARRGIAIENSGDVHAGEVADFAMTLLLAARRQLLLADKWVRSGDWEKGWMPLSPSVSNARIGIVGLGYIGEAVARRAEPFGPEIRWWGPRPKPGIGWQRHETLLELAQWCDVLVVAARAHDDTRGLISREIIDAVGPQGMIVNVSRGFVIDEDAMIAALEGGQLGQAALDVFDTEPTPPERWRDVPNVVLAPHCAGSTTISHILLQNHMVGRLKALLNV